MRWALHHSLVPKMHPCPPASPCLLPPATSAVKELSELTAGQGRLCFCYTGEQSHWKREEAEMKQKILSPAKKVTP